MAEEVQYGIDSAANKRKYEDQTTPRRATGFSAPIVSQSPSYNNVPPPMDEIQLAKQRAQEIAARLFNSAEAKRPRVENGFDSNEPKPFTSDMGQKPAFNVPHSIPTSYGYPGASKKIEIPNGRVGVIIGKGGETIKYLQLQSGAKIQVTRDMDADPNSPTRAVELVGTQDQIAKAEQLIHDVLAEAETGGSGVVSRRVTGPQGGGGGGGEQFVMQVPNNKVGLIIGKGGETIKSMQANTGARIQVIPLHLPPGDPSTERTVQIDGSSEQIEAAKQLVNEVISENRPRNQGMGGGYSQNYQARPPTSWAPPGQQVQQPNYGYVQPGAYPVTTPQYNMTQPQYGGYPPQPAASGGYATGWDQTTGQPTTAQGGGYDYYNQQQAPTQPQQIPGGPGAPVDNSSAYAYSQQGYTQDGYGGYSAPQSGYGQPYDQGYGNVPNQTPEGQTASYGETNQAPAPVQQGYGATTQQPSPSPNPNPNPSYPPPTSQPGYGVPPVSQPGYPGYGPPPPQVQKPPVYGQQPPQQSPSAAQGGGYVQPGGYPQSQPPPAQSGYGTATAPGYAAPPYGAPPPVAAQQPPYNSYGGGYTQPPATYDAVAPASQPKTSPQS